MENRENFGPVWFERVFNKSRGLGWWGYGLNGLRYQPKVQVKKTLKTVIKNFDQGCNKIEVWSH